MSLTLVVIVVIVIIVIVMLLIYTFRPQTFAEQFNAMVDRFMRRSENSLDDKTAAKLGLSNIAEMEIDSTEIHFKYVIQGSDSNRVVIVVTDTNSVVYMNKKPLTNVLETSDVTKSVVGYSRAGSGDETIRVVKAKDNTSSDPRVYVGSKEEVARRARVEVVNDDDILDGI